MPAVQEGAPRPQLIDLPASHPGQPRPVVSPEALMAIMDIKHPDLWNTGHAEIAGAQAVSDVAGTVAGAALLGAEKIVYMTDDRLEKLAERIKAALQKHPRATRLGLGGLATAALLGAACTTPAAPKQPEVVGTQVVVLEPGALATAKAGEASFPLPPGTPNPSGTAGGKPAPTESPAQTETKLSKEQALVMVDDIITKIQNPDPALLDKYHVDPKALHNDQVIIINGGEPGDMKTTGGKQYTNSSLLGLKDLVATDPEAARALLLQLYPRIRNASFGDVTIKRMSLNEAITDDPEKKFLSFGNAGQGYTGSAVKQEAASTARKLFYGL